jgi:hypothetical protein
MAEILKFKRPKPGEKHKGKTLCAHGYHKWKLSGGPQFDVKQGRLVTVSVCERCGAMKTEAR